MRRLVTTGTTNATNAPSFSEKDSDATLKAAMCVQRAPDAQRRTFAPAPAPVRPANAGAIVARAQPNDDELDVRGMPGSGRRRPRPFWLPTFGVSKPDGQHAPRSHTEVAYADSTASAAGRDTGGPKMRPPVKPTPRTPKPDKPRAGAPVATSRGELELRYTNVRELRATLLAAVDRLFVEVAAYEAAIDALDNERHTGACDLAPLQGPRRWRPEPREPRRRSSLLGGVQREQRARRAAAENRQWREHSECAGIVHARVCSTCGYRVSRCDGHGDVRALTHLLAEHHATCPMRDVGDATSRIITGEGRRTAGALKHTSKKPRIGLKPDLGLRRRWGGVAVSPSAEVVGDDQGEGYEHVDVDAQALAIAAGGAGAGERREGRPAAHAPRRQAARRAAGATDR